MISYLLKLLKKRRFDSYKRGIIHFIEMGDSFFYNSFRLISFPQPAKDKKALKIGDNTILDCTIMFDSAVGEVTIGDNNWIGASRIVCKTKIEIDDNVFISWGCYISDHDSHSTNYINRKEDIQQQLANYKSGKPLLADKNWDVVKSKPIKICSNAWVGMNCIILKGVIIGEGAIVAAGSVVTKDVPAWSVVAGNPAQVVKMLTK